MAIELGNGREVGKLKEELRPDKLLGRAIGWDKYQ